MKTENLKKASQLFEEITELNRFNQLLKNAKGINESSAHFALLEHYGVIERHNRVDIPKRFNDRFLKLLKEIIVEVYKEIEELQ